MLKRIMVLTLLLFALTACRAQPDIPSEAVTDAPAATLLTPSENPAADPIEPGPDTSQSTTAAQQEIPLYNDYSVSLEIDPETRIITGIERIRYTNHTDVPLDEIVARVYLNAFDKNVSPLPYFLSQEGRVFPNGMDYGRMNILHVSMDNNDLAYVLDGTVLTIRLNEPLKPEQTIQLKIQFDAYVPKIAHRTGANDRALWCGAFLPVLSVYGKNGWHTEPYTAAGDPLYTETANYRVEITAPEGYVVAGTGNKQEDMLDNKRITTLTAKMTRDFAFAISADYRIAVRTTGSGVDINLYYYSEDLRIDEILDAAEKSMDYCERVFGAYPYSQLYIAETDMFVTGMEFSKIVFMDSAGLKRTTDYAHVIHEIAHQWFFNVVGNNPYKEAWLDEGLALYIQDCVLYDTPEAFLSQLESNYNNLKENLPAINQANRMISADVSGYENWSGYYLVQYVKAKLMIYALRQIMGEEAFDLFLREYYNAFSFKSATGRDFVTLAERTHGSDLTEFFNEWMYSIDLPVIAGVNVNTERTGP